MNQPTDASAMFAPIWRRKWLILIVGILVAVGTYLYYRHEAQPNYQASTQIYLGAGAEEQTQIGGTGIAGAKKSGVLEPTAQATLINSSIIKGAVRERLRKQRKTKVVRAALNGKTKAKASEKSEFITLTAEAHSARGAALLANLTAQTYESRENRKFRRGVEAAISLTRRQLRRIESSAAARSESATASKGSKSSSKSGAPSAAETLQATNLASKINELEADLGIVSVRQLNPVKPKSVVKISSSPKQNAIFGFAVGLLLAALIVYALARLDHRLRTLEEIEAVFETEILTALRAVRRPVVQEDGAPPRPAKSLRDALQRLHTNLQVGRARGQDEQPRPRTILFLSADPGDGVSTVLADLALTQSDSGEAVAVVEANLRRPVLARLLGVSGREGLADVLERRLGAREAIQGVGTAPPLPGSEQPAADGVTATVVQAPSTGSASVLTAGTAAANPPALLAGAAMADTLRALAEEFDYVLIDAPGPLEVSDVMPLLRLVDGLVIVARVGQTREISARRLVQLLARTPSAPVLGVVANGASQQDIERFGFSTQNARSWRSRLSRL